MKRWRLLWLLTAAGVSMILLYAISRLYNLTLLPIFTDEAIYIRWSQIGSRDANWRFISLTDGKQPMYTWIAMVLLRLIQDPLYAGRMVSVIAGLFTLAAIGMVSFELFRSYRLSLIACLLYIISPFSLMYDRLALYDSLVSTFYLWSIYLAILLARRLRLDIALLMGMMLGLGMLNKTSGFLSLYLLPTTLILFDWTKKKKWTRFIQWIGLAITAAVLSQFMYSVLRLSPLFHMISLKDTVFVYTFSEWITHPLLVTMGNLQGLFDWLTKYLTIPIFIASLLPVFLAKYHLKEKILLYGWWILPFVALATFGKVLYPRFILFMSMPLIILSAYSLDWLFDFIRHWLLTLCVILLILIPSIRASYFILTDPANAPIPQSDLGQLINDWPAGGGVREVNAFLKRESAKGKVSVFTEGTFGLLPYAIEIYLVDAPGIKIRGLWPVGGAMPSEMKTDSVDHPTYLVLNLSQKPPPDWPLILIAEYQKGNNPNIKLRLFRVDR